MHNPTLPLWIVAWINLPTTWLDHWTLPLMTPSPWLTPWIQCLSPQIAVVLTAPHQVTARQFLLKYGLPCHWQGYTHVPLNVVVPHQGMLSASSSLSAAGVHPCAPASGGVLPVLHTCSPLVSWVWAYSYVQACGGISPQLLPGSLSPHRHFPKSTPAAPLLIPTVADGEVAAPPYRGSHCCPSCLALQHGTRPEEMGSHHVPL